MSAIFSPSAVNVVAYHAWAGPNSRVFRNEMWLRIVPSFFTLRLIKSNTRICSQSSSPPPPERIIVLCVSRSKWNTCPLQRITSSATVSRKHGAHPSSLHSLQRCMLFTTNVYASFSNNRRSIYGITVLQTFYYYNHYGNTDRSAWLILVAVIL